MTDEERKEVALAYLGAVDNGGQLPEGGNVLDLFADDAQVFFPKWGMATGIEAIGRLFADIGGTIEHIRHDYETITWTFSGSGTIVAEGTSHGRHRDGFWGAGNPEWAAGRWCDVFEIRDGKIHRCFVYLDPDYAGVDTARYPWLRNVIAGNSHESAASHP
jgi:ketosteroid isomerase-like protein